MVLFLCSHAIYHIRWLPRFTSVFFCCSCLFPLLLVGNSIEKPISACLNVTPFKYEIQLLCTAPFRSRLKWFNIWLLQNILYCRHRNYEAWEMIGKTKSKYSKCIFATERMWHFSVEKWMLSWKWFNWNCHANIVLKTHQFP